LALREIERRLAARSASALAFSASASDCRARKGIGHILACENDGGTILRARLIQGGIRGAPLMPAALRHRTESE